MLPLLFAFVDDVYAVGGEADDRRDKMLALQALHDSDKLLREIEIAKDHIQRVFRVQIAVHAPKSLPPRNIPTALFITLPLASPLLLSRLICVLRILGND